MADASADATLEAAIARHAARRAMQSVFAQTAIPKPDEIRPGLTPGMGRIDRQRRHETDWGRPWPRRRFENLRFEDLCRFNRLLNVSPEAATAWHASNRVMVVVELWQDGPCWMACASLWEAPSEAAFMGANDSDPAPDDATLVSRGWRRAGGSPVQVKADREETGRLS